MRSCDVLIIGGGPAGSACATRLRRRGVDVVVWDRQSFPRDKICAGWITPQVVGEIGLDLEEYASSGHAIERPPPGRAGGPPAPASGRTLQPIRGFRVGIAGQGEVDVRYDEVVSYGIRRCEFDEYLLRRSGAELRLGESVHMLERQGSEWVLNGEIRAPLLIGAGGHFCPVAQLLGARLGHDEPIVAAQETEVYLPAGREDQVNVEGDMPEIFFTADLRGYGWVFRKGRYVNVGLGRQDSHRLGEHVEEFVAFLRRRGKISDGVLGKMRGHPYLLYGQAPRPLVADHALLIGDAAGLAYPRSGEGIRPAIESGLMAADAVVAGRGRTSAADLRAYERQVIERFGPRAPGGGILDLLPEWVTQSAATALLRSRWFARRVVMDRWFFHVQQAPLI